MQDRVALQESGRALRFSTDDLPERDRLPVWRGSTGFSFNGMVATASGSLGWRHAAGDVTPASLLAFAGGSSSFNILGVPIAQDSAVIEAGFDVRVARNITVGFSYVGQAASNAQDQDFKANMTWRF